MGYQIVWSEDAISDYHQNIDYLLNNWPIYTAENFIEEVSHILELIQKNPNLFPLSGYKQTKKAVIRGQITLFYKIENEQIYLVRFWNNYRDPKKMQPGP